MRENKELGEIARLDETKQKGLQKVYYDRKQWKESSMVVILLVFRKQWKESWMVVILLVFRTRKRSKLE